MKTKPLSYSLGCRLLAWPLGLAVAALLFAAASQSVQAGGDPRIMPPTAKVEGKSLADWTKRFMVDALTGAPINDDPWMNLLTTQVGQVLILGDGWGIDHVLTVKPGTFLSLPLQMQWGELYSDGTSSLSDLGEEERRPVLVAGVRSNRTRTLCLVQSGRKSD